MRWRKKTLKNGTTRSKKMFLLFPKRIRGEWRWFEVCKWEEIGTAEYRTGQEVWYRRKWLN